MTMEAIESIIAGCAESAAEDCRRVAERFPMNTLLKITPMDRDREPLRGRSFTAIGKDLSTGVSVSHAEPMRYSRAVITTMRPEAGQFCVEVEVAWTKATVGGIHETGFKLVRKLK
jgi:hypothetical protein